MCEIFNMKYVLNNEINIAVVKIFDDDIIKLQFKSNHINILKSADNHFDALLELRKDLEKMGIKLLCKGCCENVYPSAMMFDMGNTRKAYTLNLGESAKKSSLVDIFDECYIEEYVSIKEQQNFFNKWSFNK